MRLGPIKLGLLLWGAYTLGKRSATDPKALEKAVDKGKSAAHKTSQLATKMVHHLEQQGIGL